MEDGRGSQPCDSTKSDDLDRDTDLSMTDTDASWAKEKHQRNVFPIAASTYRSGTRSSEESNPVHLLSQEQLEDQEYQKQWDDTLHSDPGIQYVGIRTNSPINRLHINTNRILKRKMEATNSKMSPSRKQHITEEKMAACMQGLSLENEQIRRSVKNINNDSDFEDDSDIDDEPIEEASIDPVFELHVDFRDRLRELTTIVPTSVLNEMRTAESTNLAIVPYVPRDSLLLKTDGNNDDEVVNDDEPESNSTDGKCSNNNNMLVDLDSKYDNDLMFE